MKKNSLTQIMGYIIIPLIFDSCLAGDYMYDMDIVNNSNHKIGYTVPGPMGGAELLYPDTTLSKNILIMYDLDIKASSLGFVHQFPSWKKFFKSFPRDTLSIYIFHTDTLNKYPWETVSENYMVLKRYDLSLRDFEKLDFKVPYPPSATMANMKMFPPYK